MPLNEIEHIFFVMLENRSFDHMLGYLSLDDTPNPIAVDGLRTAKAWRDSFANLGDGIPYAVQELSPKPKPKIADPPHNKDTIAYQIDTAPAGPGPTQMGGFVQAYINSRTQAKDKKGKPKPKPKPKRPGDVMGYYNAAALPAYDFLARNYCVCDRWFTPLPLGTQANRLMAMAGESRVVNNVHDIGDFPDQELVYTWLDRREDTPWRVYTWGGFVPFFTLMKRYRGTILGSMVAGKGPFRRYSRFAGHWRDMTKPFPKVVFIEPEYGEGPGLRPNDDHPPTGVAGGQALVADIYNTLISNPVRWAKTLMIVTYDEHGGFFDHVPPLAISAKAGAETFHRTGPRVPALLVSPHVARGQVYSGNLDHTSFLQLLVDRFAGGADYSPAVAERQKALTGRIADALRPARTEKPKPLVMPAVEEHYSPVHEWLSGRPKFGARGTPTGVALDGAVRELFAEHPELAERPEFGEMTAYVRTTRPPELEALDHVAD